MPVQNILPVAPAPNSAGSSSSAAGGTAAASTAPGDDATTSAAANTPRGFGALLALQLGGAGKTLTVGEAKSDTAIDDKTAADSATTASTTAAATTLDPLAGLNLPALSPVVTSAVTTAAARPTGNAAAETPAHGRPAAAGLEPNALPRVAADKAEASVRTAEPVAAGRSESSAFAREAAALQAAAGARTGEPVAHAGEARAPDAAQLAQLQLNATPAPAATAAPVQAAIEARVGTPDWNTELGQKIVWMVGDKQQVAELHVNPPDLGPLDIKLTIDGSQTTAVFTSPHTEVREAVESALPRLREVLAESGLMLGNASVTADTPRDSQAFAEPQRGGRSGGPAAADTGAPAAPLRVVRESRGLVDLFA
jgi:flagellar hook-length control protein FliK